MSTCRLWFLLLQRFTSWTVTYPIGTKPAFEDVTLQIEKGEFVVLTGPSGCGKTTLCRCFNGLIPHFYSGKLEGEITVSELRVSEHPIHELAQHVGMVFQNPENQLFALSVEKDAPRTCSRIKLDNKNLASSNSCRILVPSLSWRIAYWKKNRIGRSVNPFQ